MKITWDEVWRRTDAAAAPFVIEVVDCGDIAMLRKIATNDSYGPPALLITASAREMRTQPGLVRAVGAAFGFSDGDLNYLVNFLKYPYGWHALRDKLKYIQEPKFEKLVFVITEAELFLVDDSKIVPYYEGMLAEVGQYWATPIRDGSCWAHEAAAFHTVLAFTDRAALKSRKSGHGKPRST